MTEEKKVVLKMLEEGKISAKEAESLLETFKTEASQRAEKIKADISSGLAKIGTGVENAAKSVAKLNPKDKIDAYRDKVKNEPPITFTNTEGAGDAVPNDVQSACEDSKSNPEDLQQSLDKLAEAYNGINKEAVSYTHLKAAPYLLAVPVTGALLSLFFYPVIPYRFPALPCAARDPVFFVPRTAAIWRRFYGGVRESKDCIGDGRGL